MPQSYERQIAGYFDGHAAMFAFEIGQFECTISAETATTDSLRLSDDDRMEALFYGGCAAIFPTPTETVAEDAGDGHPLRL